MKAIGTHHLARTRSSAGLSASLTKREAWERLTELQEQLDDLTEARLYCVPGRITARGQRFIDFGEELKIFSQEVGKTDTGHLIPIGTLLSSIKSFEDNCRLAGQEVDNFNLSKSPYAGAMRRLWEHFDLSPDDPKPEKPKPPEPDPPEDGPDDSQNDPPPDSPPDSPSDDSDTGDTESAGLPLPLLLGGTMAVGAAWLWYQSSTLGADESASESEK